MVFGHRKCSGGYRVHIESPEGVPGTPGKRYGPNGPRGETQQPAGAAAPPIWAAREEKERGEERRKGRDSASPFLPSFLLLPFPSEKYVKGGGGANWTRLPVGILH